MRWRRWFAGGAAVVVAVSSLHGRRLLSPLLQGFSLFLPLFVFFFCFGVPLFLSFFSFYSFLFPSISLVLSLSSISSLSFCLVPPSPLGLSLFISKKETVSAPSITQRLVGHSCFRWWWWGRGERERREVLNKRKKWFCLCFRGGKGRRRTVSFKTTPFCLIFFFFFFYIYIYI